ncbi:MAG: FAD-dependent monooxygenase [bacterium]
MTGNLAPNSSSEILIVGGGVAGLALAARLGAAGREVTLVEKAPLSRDKVCGEGLMPSALAQLQAWGMEPAAIPGEDFTGLEYRTRRRGVVLPFADGVHGRGVRRTELILALEVQVNRSPSVTRITDWITGAIWEGGRIVGAHGRRRDYRASVVAAADGVNSALVRTAGVPLRARGFRMALRRHFRNEDPKRGNHASGRVRVGLFSPYDLYITPVEDGAFLATLMTDRTGYQAAVGGMEHVLRSSPYGEMFEGVQPVSRQLGWYHPLFTPRRYCWKGLLLVGDAGGGTDPCLGVGISMALASVRQAERTVLDVLDSPEDRKLLEKEFDAGRKKIYNHYGRFDRVFRLMIRSGSGSELLVGLMAIWPGVSASVLDIIARDRPWREFPWKLLLEPLAFPLGKRTRDGPDVL